MKSKYITLLNYASQKYNTNIYQCLEVRKINKEIRLSKLEEKILSYKKY